MRPKSVLFEYVGLAALAAGSVALFHFYGGFHSQAAELLGIGFSLVAVWLNILRQFAMFKPYRLSIGINYRAVWEDLKLSPAQGSEDVTFSFPAISPSIFARSDEHGYSQHPSLFKPIPCGPDTGSQGPGEIKPAPSFFFRPGIGGYQFGLRVQSQWWEAHRHQFAAALRDRALGEGQATRSDELVLGLLPYGYIPGTGPISWYGFDRRQRRWKRVLEQQGWTLDNYGPTHIDHRYLSIDYSEI